MPFEMRRSTEVMGLPAEFQSVPFDFADARAALGSIPEECAVFALYGEAENAQPYIGRTPNLRGRLQRLLIPSPKHPKRLQLAGRVRRIEWRLTGSDFESLLLQFDLLQRVYGAKALERMHLGAPTFVRFMGGNPYPRLTVTNRPSLREAHWVYGPFASRAAAERFSDEALKLFLLRRCTDDLNPDPSHPGCVYSEMKMCLAPCYKGCTDEEYRAETEQVHSYFDSNGRSLLVQIATERDAASERLDFENAATLHARHEKVAAVRSQLPEIVRRIEELRGVIVQPSIEPECVTLFKIEQGCIAAPVMLNVAARQIVANAKTPMSMEARISEALETVPNPEPHSGQEWMEHLALLKRWFYRTSKIGEAFFADGKGELPMRRIVRGVSRVYKGEAPQADLSETAKEYWVNRGKEALKPIDD